MVDDLTRIAVLLRSRLAVAAGLMLTAGCGATDQRSCRDIGADCLVDTTSGGQRVVLAPAPSSVRVPDQHATVGSSTGTDGSTASSGRTTGSSGLDGVGEYDEPDIITVECVPVQDDGCPEPDSSCLAEIMEKRHWSFDCGCFEGHVFANVMSGPDPDVSDACCYDVRLVYQFCQVGRPFMVQGAPRMASPVARGDWLAPDRQRSSYAGVSDPIAEGRAWLHAARMEHASVAALARVILQLCAVGAPPELIKDTQRALSDEIHHARLCFDVASALLGRDLGPGPLPLADAVPAQLSVRDFVLDLLREGCVGESTAAALARFQAERTADPRMRRILSRIAEDETRHAALAFRTLRWLATSEHAAITRDLLRTFLDASEEHPLPLDDAPVIGGLSSSQRIDVIQAVSTETVRPLLRSVESTATSVDC